MMLFQTLLSPGGPITGVPDLETTILSGVFKILFLLSVVFYIVFAVIVIRQVQIMKNTLITPVSPIILMASILHLLVAVGVLFLFLIIL